MGESLAEVRAQAEAYGLKYEEKGNGHVQLSNRGCLVNYYPLSKRRTVFCNGVTTKDCSAFDAIRICQKGGAVNLRPSSKVLKKSKAQGSFQTQHTNPAGLQHLYSGKTPPWEFPSHIMCYPDLLRVGIALRQDAIMQQESPDFYEEPQHD